MPLSKDEMREYMRKRRAKDYAKKFSEGATTETSEAHPVYPELKRYSDREYDGSGLVLMVQKCEACGGTWGASIRMPCVYCDGKGNRKPTTRIG